MNHLNIKLKTKTWNRDSYGLYDYETTDVAKIQININKESLILREGNRIRLGINEENSLTDTICQFNEEDGNCYVKNWKNNELWLSLSPKLDKNHSNSILKQGDEFRLGRIKFKILQINLRKEEKLEPHYKTFKLSIFENYEFCKEKNIIEAEEDFLDIVFPDSIKNCRICLFDTEEEDNPLINPCLCSGTMKYVHLNCIQRWLSIKLNFERKNGVLSILWNALCCELCNSTFPLSINYRGKIYDILNFNNEEKITSPDLSIYSNSTICNNKEKKEKNSVLLKSYNKEGNPLGIHYIEFCNLNKNEITIGRGIDAHIKINDISVSRNHSKIVLNKNKLILFDNNSKFGTLLKIDKKILNLIENKIFLQAGRTAIEISVNRKWNNIFKCFSCSNKIVEKNTLTYKK